MKENIRIVPFERFNVYVTDRHFDRQTDQPTDRQTDRQTDREQTKDNKRQVTEPFCHLIALNPTWKKALVFDCSLGVKSPRWAAIFSIILRRISEFQMASGVSYSPVIKNLKKSSKRKSCKLWQLQCWASNW